MTVSNCNFKGNAAISHGGAIATLLGTKYIKNSQFNDNSAAYCGALYIKSDSASI